MLGAARANGHIGQSANFDSLRPLRCLRFVRSLFVSRGKGALPPLPSKEKIGLPVLPPLWPSACAPCRIDADPHPRIMRRPFGFASGREIPLRFVSLPPSPRSRRRGLGSRSGAPAPSGKSKTASREKGMENPHDYR